MNDEFNTSGLDKMIRILSEKPPEVQVGILATPRSDSPLTNAEIGEFHEYGTSKIPRRSFLKDPLAEKFNGEIEKSKDFSEDALKAILKTGTLETWMQTSAEIGKEIVLGAFDTAGYGKWAAHASPTDHPLLDETGQLKAAVYSEVKK